MIQSLAEGFSLGLATGIVCLSTCTPIYLPYLLSSDRKLLKSFGVILEISAGRFFSYLTFGAIAGFLGAQIGQVNRDLFTAIAYIMLSVYLILSAVRSRNEHKKCAVPKMAAMTRSPFVLGILTGINFCPAFLIALSNALNLAGALSGMLLFMGFFFGTSLFLIPLALANFLTKIRQMKQIAQVASVLIGIWFIGKGLFMLYGYAVGTEVNNPFAPGKELAVVSSEADMAYFTDLRDSLQVRTDEAVDLLEFSPGGALEKRKSVLYFVNRTLVEQDSAAFEGMDYFAVEAGYPIGEMMMYLTTVFQGCPDESEYGDGNNNLCSTCTLTKGLDFSGRFPVDFEQKELYMMDVFAPGNQLVILADNDDPYWKELQNTLQANIQKPIQFMPFDPGKDLPNEETTVYIIPQSAEQIAQDSGWIDSLHTIVVPKGYSPQTIAGFLKKFTFKVENRLSWHFDADK